MNFGRGQWVLVVAHLHVKRGGRQHHYEIHREKGEFVVCVCFLHLFKDWESVICIIGERE